VTEHASAKPLLAVPSDSLTLRDSVAYAINQYFSNLDGQQVTGLYDLVLAEVEPPLLTAVLRQAQGNQTVAADLLGINRGTLRKKLLQYDLL